jgi:hypothetical protein
MPTLPQINNLYVIAALATIGGLIQGFDVSSLSAIIGTKQVRDAPEPALTGFLDLSIADQIAIV